MRRVVLVNPQAGPKPDPRRTARIRRALRAERVRAELRSLDPDRPMDDMRDALKEGIDVLVVAGGDGTVGAAAAAVAGTDVTLAVLPLGTRNHFAKDAGIPWRLRAAIRVLRDGRSAQVDVAEVNHRPFINNASIGLYPRVLARRAAQTGDYNRWIASALAATSVVRRNRRVHVRIEAEQESLEALTPFVFVGNNPYEIDRFRLGRRARLDRGTLGVYLAGPVGRAALLSFPFRAVAGRLRSSEDFRALETREVRVDSLRTRLRVAVDGELHRMRPPLRFRARPRALRILVPRPGRRRR